MNTGYFAGLWDVVSCSDKENYVCKKVADGIQLSTVAPTTPALSCAYGWTPVSKRNVCYKVRREKSVKPVLCSMFLTLSRFL